MPDAVKLTDNHCLDASLELIHGVQLDEAMIRAHVMRPENVLGVSSDRGRDDPRVPAAIGGPPVVHPGYALDVRGFLDAIEAQLNHPVAGYAMRLNENGAPIATLEWGWAKEPQDGGEGWTPDTRQHVASLSKQPTAIAMTRLLSEKGLYPDTAIIDYLPDYWVKGPNVEQITFARLLTHTSGLNYGAPAGGPSDYESMKAAIAAGTTHLGEFWYQNMNFGLCRILISTINGNISPSAIWTGLLSSPQRHVLGPGHALGLPELRPRERVRALRGDRSDPRARDQRRARVQLPGIRQRLELGRSNDDGGRHRLAHDGR